ncbi:cytochrome c4 [Aliidiomarina taiwanensis]|uniref:Cytochrome c4 n=1 Tax=Aliidiomarina taiwanensis TaxID=946228 RepID=A0A432X183_9GAMM|nr:c-type cytochrome [Aliidiomarina taiwanensis]RUO39871.1 cytochrome c4 [Aliidiomarina taiwanensis]
MAYVSIFRRTIGWVMAVTGLSLASFASLASELDPAAVQRGQAAAAICSSCHQQDGSGMNIPGGESWPRLAGLNSDYLIRQVHAFKEGTRQSASMMPFANILNDDQLRDVASYYASLNTPPKTPPAVDPTVLEHGKKLALEGDWSRYIVPCSSCHGPSNQGVGSAFPGLAGQHPGYIAQQLEAWQKGTRSNDPQNLMGAIAKRLNSDDIAAVSAWLATQPAQ